MGGGLPTPCEVQRICILRFARDWHSWPPAVPNNGAPWVGAVLTEVRRSRLGSGLFGALMVFFVSFPISRTLNAGSTVRNRCARHGKPEGVRYTHTIKHKVPGINEMKRKIIYDERALHMFMETLIRSIRRILGSGKTDTLAGDPEINHAAD